MAVPTFVAAGTHAVFSGAGDVVPALPVGWAAGDLHVCLYGTNTGTFVPPAGWTSLGTQAGSTVFLIGAAWRIAQGGDTAPSIGGSGLSKGATVLGFRGVDTVSPINAFTFDTEATNDTSVSIAGLTTTVIDTLVVDCSWVALNGRTLSGWTNASLGSLTEILDRAAQRGAAAGSLSVNTGTKAVAGAVSATTATLSGSAANKASLKFAIAPGSPPPAASGNMLLLF